MNEPKKAADQEEARAHEPASGFARADKNGLADQTADGNVGEPDALTALENLQAENAGLKDRLLRTMADMENLRRRTEREIGEQRIYSVTNLARDMLGFADNLRRAIDSLGPEVREGADAPLKSFIEGVEVTERDFLSRLARHGIKKIEAQGQKFNPNQEEALFEVPDESVPAGTVVQVIEPGYMIGERVLRPAKVGISKGGPKG